MAITFVIAMRRQPRIRESPGMGNFGNEPHVSMNRQHVGKAEKNGADRAILLGALPVDDIWPDFSQFLAERQDAAKKPRPQPADFGHEQTVKKMFGASFSG